jgi:Icc-related predicted phosphoesterase
VTMRIYFATDIHGSEVCWRKFLNAARFYQADTLILGGDVSGKAVVPVVARPGDGFLIRQFHGERVLTADETEEGLVDLGEGITMLSFGYSNPTPWHTPRELPDDEILRRVEKKAAAVERPERAVFNLHVPPARTAIDRAPALDGSLKPVVKGGAVVMESVGSEAVRHVLEEYQPMLGLHGHIHESRGAVRLGSTLAVNPGSEYGDGVLCGALLEIDGKRGVRHYQLPTG